MESEQSPAPEQSFQDEPHEESKNPNIPDTADGKTLIEDQKDDSDIEAL